MKILSQLSGVEEGFKNDPRFGIVKSNQTLTQNGKAGVFIKTKNIDTLRNFLQKNSGTIQSVIGNIVTAQISVDSIAALKNVEGIVYVELAQPVRTNLDLSRKLIGADLVQNGTNLSQSYTGKGTLIGIVDSGIDWKHSTFSDGSNGSRVKTIWDQSLSPSNGFVGPSEMVNTYGLECVEQDLDLGDNGLCPSQDLVGHGTHVAGIAAGSDSTFKGIAPEAEIIAVKIPMIESSAKDYTVTVAGEQSFANYVVDGVNYIFQKAAVLHKPVVINISLGTQFGPHDSSSLFEEALNNLVTAAPGRSIVVSAGNSTNISGSYFSSVHSGFSLQGETKAVEFISEDTWLHSLIIDIWQPAESNLSFGIGVDDYKNYQKTPMSNPGNSTSFSTADGALNISIDSSETQNPLNGKKHTLIYIVAAKGNKGVAIATSKYIFDLIVSGSGRFDGWIASGGIFTKRSGTLSRTGLNYQPGDSQKTVGVPGTANKVLTVSSYSSRNSLGDISFLTGETLDLSSLIVGHVSSFSSIGPSADLLRTGQKPEISAPGEWIMSAMSSYAQSQFDAENSTRAGNFVLLKGTSMAAPHVTGAVALLLEQNPSLMSDEIKRRLFLTTDNSQPVGATPIPDNRIGYGKINIARAMTYDNFVSNGYDFNSRQFSTSSDPTPEIAYDGGATDKVKYGIKSVATARAGTEASAADPNNNASVNGVESAGGCSLVSSEKILIPPALLILFVFPIAMLVTFRSGKYFFIPLILIFLSGCGGGGGDGGAGSPSPDSSLSTLLGSLDLSKEAAQVSLDKGWVSTTTINTDATKAFVLIMPLKHLFAEEIVPLSADGFYTFHPDEGLLLIYEGQNMGTPNYISTHVYVATAGSFVLHKASVRSSEVLSGTFKVDQMVPFDLKTGLIKRGEAGGTLSSDFSTTIKSGGTDQPYVVDSLTTAENKTISLKGFNLHSVDQVSFKHCSYNIALPFQASSDNLLQVTMNQFGCAIQEGFTLRYGSFATVETSDFLRMGIPYVQDISLPAINSQTNGAFLYDVSRQSVYWPDSDNKRVFVFSMNTNKLLETVYYNDETRGLWDVSLDGSSLVTFDSFYPYPHNLIRFDLSNIGTVNSLTRSSLNLSTTPYLADFYLGKKNKGIINVNSEIELLDINSGSLTSFPESLKTANFDSLIRSQKREYVVCNSSSDDTVVYHALDSGDFQKLSSANIGKKILGIAETAEELWSVDSIFDLNLVQKNSYGGNIPNWDTSTAIGIFFDPSNTYAILISRKGVIHILNRATQAVLATNVPVLHLQNGQLLNQYVLSDDGTRLLLSSEGYLHSVDLKALFASLGFSY